MFDRFDSILEALQTTSLETLGRREVQSLFGCAERDSLRLLNRFGAAKRNDALQLDRTSLLHQLEALRESQTYAAFRQKTQRVAVVTAAKPASKARFRRIAGSVSRLFEHTTASMNLAILDGSYY